MTSAILAAKDTLDHWATLVVRVIVEVKAIQEVKAI